MKLPRRCPLAAQARAPKDEAVRIKERAAKRKMTGVSLQYTDDDRVFFEDVAGIGDAKVRGPCTLSTLQCQGYRVASSTATMQLPGMSAGNGSVAGCSTYSL